MKNLGIKEEVLGTENTSRGPPQDGIRDFDDSHDPEYDNEYDDCLDVDYSDQF
jgi:hypothetical protein